VHPVLRAKFAKELKPRAITRDLDWGVPIPLEGWREAT
jgi:methionyl-tRNA synthetase